MTKHTTILIGLLLLAACGPSKLDQSEANYKQCLASNPASTQNCEGLRKIYEMDRHDDSAWRREVERQHDATFNAAGPRGMVNAPNASCATPGVMNCY